MLNYNAREHEIQIALIMETNDGTVASKHVNLLKNALQNVTNNDE